MYTYYEVPLYWSTDGFHVARPGDLGEGWERLDDLLREVSCGYPVVEIREADLPYPLLNSTYLGMRLYRQEGQFGPSYFGVAERWTFEKGE